ncbi:MAG TPA: hypothetical protein VI753_00250, partial [Anaerolineales bacterium]|nr:hypothetical protein [Anaerolineales bacterium]
MPNYICATCGVQYTETESSPEHCIICEDERQYIGHKGQRWTTLPEMQKNYHNRIEDVDPNVTGIGTVPGFAIGQRALLIVLGVYGNSLVTGVTPDFSGIMA